jgi:glutaredoxin
MTARVVLYSKPGCHLCDDARTVVAQVCGELGEAFEEVDITAGAAADRLTRAYGEEIPVTFVDGEQHDFWRVDPDRLRAALTRHPRQA